MTRDIPLLSSQFIPASYQLLIAPDGETAQLTILGQKAGRPSKRITLHQKGLKITGAKVTAQGKASKHTEVSRINHLPAREEVRIHTGDILYPGKYLIELEYRLPADNSIKAIVPSRECLPCIDEPEAWANAKLEIKQ